MASIISNLNTLQTSIINCKKTLATNITAKGVTTITSANTMTELANAVSGISAGGGTSKISLSGNQRWYDKLDEFDFSNVTDMSYMFQYCSNLSGVSLDTSNATNTTSMFYGCINLKTINITNFGKASGLTDAVDFSTTIWGQTSSSDKRADDTAVQSIRGTLLTNSFDRATAGYSALTIKLKISTWKYLTNSEKASITAKGYTLTA